MSLTRSIALPSTRLSLLMIGSLIFQTVQMSIIPILLAQLLSQSGLQAVWVGVVLAISWVSVLAFGPFVPTLMKRLGDLGSFVFAALLTGLALLLLLISNALPFAVGAAVLAGAGLIVRWIAADTLVVDMSESEARGTMIGYHEALMGLGIALGPLAFVVFELRDVKLTGLALILVGLICSVLALVKTKVPKGKHESDPTVDGAQVRSIISIGLAAALVAGIIENSAIALLPIYYEAFGYSLTTSAIFVSGFGMGGTVLQPPLGILSDKRGAKFAQGFCIAVSMLLGLIAVFVTGPTWLLVVILFLLGGSVGGLNTLAVIEAGTLLPSVQIPAAMTAIALFYTAGSIIGPALSGVLLDLPYRPAMMIGFVVATAILGVWLSMRRS